MKRINVIDSHKGGEPTRIIVKGGSVLGNGPLDERVNIFQQEFDHIRSAVVAEPRGSAHINGEATLILQSGDPFRMGIKD